MILIIGDAEDQTQEGFVLQLIRKLLFTEEIIIIYRGPGARRVRVCVCVCVYYICTLLINLRNLRHSSTFITLHHLTIYVSIYLSIYIYIHMCVCVYMYVCVNAHMYMGREVLFK